jgi:hypothetical protein
MNASIKNGLIFAAKNAVNAALVAVGPILATPQSYNLNTGAGLKHVGILMGSAVVSRELMVWVPKLMKWSSTNGSAPGGQP